MRSETESGQTAGYDIERGVEVEKPNERLIKLYNIGYIKAVKLSEKLGACMYTSEIYVEIVGSVGKCKGKWDLYRNLLVPNFGAYFVAELRDSDKRKVKEWLEFERENKKDLEEYERLKKKFK